MAFPFLETTAPAAAQTTDARGQVPMLALVIVQCEKEPWRVGQYALFPLGKKRWLGRRGGGEPHPGRKDPVDSAEQAVSDHEGAGDQERGGMTHETG